MRPREMPTIRFSGHMIPKEATLSRRANWQCCAKFQIITEFLRIPLRFPGVLAQRRSLDFLSLMASRASVGAVYACPTDIGPLLDCKTNARTVGAALTWTLIRMNWRQTSA